MFRTDSRDGFALLAAAAECGVDARFIITTNCIVRPNGCAVMGAGLARTARERFPGIDRRYGDALRAGREVVYDGQLVLLPTKDDWRQPSSITRIERSLRILLETFPSSAWLIVPRLGCANGGLRWSEVRPVVESLLMPIRTRVIFTEPRLRNES